MSLSTSSPMGGLIDIVAAGFDAGVRLREAVPQDMVAVPFGAAVRFLPVGAPAYLARFGTPLVPDDLRGHRCIRHRLPSGRTYRWEFEKHGQELVIERARRLVAGQQSFDGHGSS